MTGTMLLIDHIKQFSLLMNGETNPIPNRSSIWCL